jgi:hypothetical protein
MLDLDSLYGYRRAALGLAEVGYVVTGEQMEHPHVANQLPG